MPGQIYFFLLYMYECINLGWIPFLLDLLKLRLLTVVSHHMGSMNQTWVLCKSKQLLLIRRPLHPKTLF